MLGKTTVSDLGITGNLTLGLLSISSLSGEEQEGASLQTLAGPLKLQEKALGDVQLFGGEVVMTTTGDVHVQGTVKATRFEGEEAEIKKGKFKEAEIEEANVSKLCLGDLCVNKDQFKKLLEGSGLTTPSPTETPNATPEATTP